MLLISESEVFFIVSGLRSASDGNIAGGDLKASLEQLVNKARTDAKAGIKEVDRLRELIKQLVCQEGLLNFVEALRVAEVILKSCPYYKVALVSRANALCELQRFTEAKQGIELAMFQSHSSILKLSMHTSGQLPYPNPILLDWKEKKSPSPTSYLLEIDTDHVVNAILCMGSEISQIYLVALKV